MGAKSSKATSNSVDRFGEALPAYSNFSLAYNKLRMRKISEKEEGLGYNLNSTNGLDEDLDVENRRVDNNNMSMSSRRRRRKNSSNARMSRMFNRISFRRKDSSETLHKTGPSKILNRLYLGDREDGFSNDTNANLGITHVLCVSSSAKVPDPQFQFMHEPMSDFAEDDLKQTLPKLWDFLKSGTQEGCKVLVHCRLGMNRSVVIVLAFLMVCENWPLEKALAYVKFQRPFVNPHPAYLKQLKQLESSLISAEFFSSISSADLLIKSRPDSLNSQASHDSQA